MCGAILEANALTICDYTKLKYKYKPPFIVKEKAHIIHI